MVSMQKLRYAACASVALVLLGCVPPTGYHEMDVTGGVTALPLGADRYKIEARGNGATAEQTVISFAYRKAAEVAKAAGANHFIIVDDADRNSITTGSTSPTATTSFIGDTAYTTVNQHTYSIPKAGRDFVIQIFRANPPTGALDADQILQETAHLAAQP